MAHESYKLYRNTVSNLIINPGLESGYRELGSGIHAHIYIYGIHVYHMCVCAWHAYYVSWPFCPRKMQDWAITCRLFTARIHAGKIPLLCLEVPVQ